MEFLRAKTLDLKATRPLTPEREENIKQNEAEALSSTVVTQSAPRRFVLEMTNACNLNCVMCGRNASDFKPTLFQKAWLDKLEPMVSQVEEVTLMGWGEPTMHPEFTTFLKWAKDRGLRTYFCSNGMKLDTLFEDIFTYETDIIAVSMDGATKEMNDQIRTGADFHKILANIQKITEHKKKHGLTLPHMNFVMTVSQTNLHQLPDLVKLADQVGLDEVKVVYLTAFDDELAKVTLFNQQDMVREYFQKAEEVAKERGILLKFPHYQGEDPAQDKPHKDCYTTYRDFFLGSDGYVRPCMSSAQKFFHIDDCEDIGEMWNHATYQHHRRCVNQEGGAYPPCENCYQSSFANWNKKESFLQVDKTFAPSWGAEQDNK